MATADQFFNGSDLLIYIGAIPVAMSRSCSLSISANMVDVTTKDSISGFAESIPVVRSWTAQVEGLVVMSNLAELTDAIFNKTKLEIKLQKRVSATGDLIYSGFAFIESMDIDSPQDEAVTYSVSFTGTGALTKTLAT